MSKFRAATVRMPAGVGPAEVSRNGIGHSAYCSCMDRLQPGDPSQIGSFRLLGLLGEGGMGRVFLGASPGGRRVAIKVVRPGYGDDPEFRRRFAREVAAARRVGGFHTAAVVGADPDADPPWMATAYIPGPSLASVIARQGPLGEAGVRELGAALAEGLAAIHACGLIHRDLKPGNIILADDGPRIIDFGIAKSADASSLTSSHALIGTLGYVSPEQLAGQELTPQSDVFALGTILAYAATGHNPFDAPGAPAVINRILNAPPSLGLLTGSLRDIIAACLAKDPGSRPGPGDLLARLSPPAGASAPAAPSVPPAATVAPPVPGPRHRAALRLRPRPQVPPGRVQHEGRRGFRRVAVLASALAITAAGLAALGVFLLGDHSGESGPASGSLAATIRTPPGGGFKAINLAAALDPTGKTLAIAVTGLNSHYDVTSGRTYLWDIAARKITAVLTDPGSKGVTSVAFAPGGTTLATGDANGRTYLWDTTTGRQTAILTTPGSKGVYSVAFAPGGATLATGDGNGRAYLWDIAARKVAAVLTDPGNQALVADGGQGVTSVAFAPGGATLATGDDNGRAYLWDIAARKVAAVFPDPDLSFGIDEVAFAPGGATLATGDDNGSTFLWDVATGKRTATLTGPQGSNGISALAFAPDGTTLAATHAFGGTAVWDITTGKMTDILNDPGSQGTESAAFAPDGAIFVNTDQNGGTYLWNITYHASSQVTRKPWKWR
jgi:hypothetical protein